MLHEFKEYRPYKSIEQFRREIGKYVDDDELARLEGYVFVPIDLNTASDEDILSLPGVGDRMRHEFDEYRACVNRFVEAHYAASDRHRVVANSATQDWNAFVRSELNVPEDFPHKSEAHR